MIIWEKCQLFGVVTAVISSEFHYFQEAKKCSVPKRFILWSKGLSLHFMTVLQEFCRFILNFSSTFGLPFKRFANYYLWCLTTIWNILFLFHISFIAFQLWTVWNMTWLPLCVTLSGVFYKLVTVCFKGKWTVLPKGHTWASVFVNFLQVV